MTQQADAEFRALQARVTGRYSIDRELGRGGMGVVFLARDVALDRRVAIKLLPQEYAAQRPLRERFLREARLAARLSHPNIVPVYAVEEHDDAVFYAMGYVEGEPLSARIARVGQLAPAEVASILQQVAWALAYAHGNGVVHRDVKPDNVMIERGTGRAWVMDFGIARALESMNEDQPQGTRLTQVGHVVGTAAYMSPEQAAGEDVDGRSDLYSLGVVAYQALTGRLPLEATSAQALLAKHLTETPPPVASVRPGIPPALAKTVDQLLAKDPAARPATGESVADMIGTAQSAQAEVPPPIREFIRSAEQNMVVTMRFVAIMIAVVAAKPSAIIAIAFGALGTIAGSFAALFFLARRLALAGYRWPDIRDAVAVDARARVEEARAIAMPPDPVALRRALIRTIVSLVGGVALFIGSILAATRIRATGIPGGFELGLTLILVGALALVATTMPLAYYVAMRRADRRSTGQREGSFFLNIWAAAPGRMFFNLAARNVKPAPPRGPAGALDLLLAEAEAAVPAEGRAAVRALRVRLDALAARERALRTRERELDRSIAEAGASAGADALSAARAAIGPEIERISAAVDAARVKLLLVRSGVAPAAVLDHEAMA